MRLKTVAELSQRDERTARFTGLGLMTDRITTPEAGARYAQEIVAPYDLDDAVPADVRDYYETCRSLCAQGYFQYEAFAVAFDRAYLAVELALKRRFLEHHRGRVPMEERATGRVESLPVEDYALLDQALRGRGPYARFRRFARSATDGWILHGHPDFDGSMRALFRWAITTGVLTGRRVAVVADAVTALRNLGAHPTSHHVVMPLHAADAIRTAAEVINRLWGVETPGGDLAPVQPPRVGLYSLHKPQEDVPFTLANPAEDLDRVPPEERAGRWWLPCCSAPGTRPRISGPSGRGARRCSA